MTVREANAAANLALALELRRQRVTYQEIANRCGYADRSGAFYAIQRALARNEEENVEAYRQEELDMLDALQRLLWPFQADKEEGTPDLDVVAAIRDISRDRRKLMGIDLEKDAAPPPALIIREYPAGITEAV